MADSNRKQIWQVIETGLKEISAIKSVYFGMAPLNTKEAAAIIPRMDGFNRSSKSTNESELEFAIRYIGTDTFQHALWEYEDVAPLIKAKMEELRLAHKAGENKLWRELTLQNEKWLFPDSEHPDTGVDLNYVVNYAP